MKSYNIMLGILAGLATGTLIGILFAPEKGAITRKNIFGKNDNYKDSLRIEFEELVGKILDKYDCTRNEAEGLVAEGKTVTDVEGTDFKSKNEYHK